MKFNLLLLILFDICNDIDNFVILINVLKRKASSENFSEKKKKKINCHVTKKKTINDQTKNENVTMINAVDENFVMHRCLMLTIVMKIDDRKKNENFIIASETNETNETNKKEINETTVIDEAAKKKK